MKIANRVTSVIFLAVALWPGGVLAQAPAAPIENSRYMRLLREVRCLSCRNASLADASSHEARDQRREILDLINANYSDDDIRKYLRARYGARALYRPDTEADTMLLWLTPIVIQSLGGLFFLRAIFRQCKRPINL